MFGFFQNPLKRFYKFIFKKFFGGLVRNELNVEQLDVQIGAGVIELKNLELNTDVRGTA